MLTPSACPSGDWYIAVNSYSGAGTYRLSWNYGFNSGVPLDACTAFHANEATRGLSEIRSSDSSDSNSACFRGPSPEEPPTVQLELAHRLLPSHHEDYVSRRLHAERH